MGKLNDIDDNIRETAEKDWGITKGYCKENRDKLWDDTKAKTNYKNMTFGDKQTYRDKISGNILHKSNDAAKNKYHMKNEAGENISTKWAGHSPETDHINSLKSLHNKAKQNVFLSDDDLREIANSKANYRVTSKSFNASKGEKSDYLLALDLNNDLTHEARTALISEKLRSDIVLQGKFAERTAKNIGSAYAVGAVDTAVENVIPLTNVAVNKMMEVINGEELLSDAVKEFGKSTATVAATGGAKKVVSKAAKEYIQRSQNSAIQYLANSNAIGSIVAVSQVIKDSAVKYVNGDIDEKEFLVESATNGSSLLMAVKITEKTSKIVSNMGKMAGLTAGVLPVLATMITTSACSAIVSAFKISRNHDYKLKENQIKRLEKEALSEMELQRKRFNELVEIENQEMDKAIKEGFNMIFECSLEKSFNAEGVVQGINRILAVFDEEVRFNSIDEYESQLDSTLQLNF